MLLKIVLGLKHIIKRSEKSNPYYIKSCLKGVNVYGRTKMLS